MTSNTNYLTSLIFHQCIHLLNRLSICKPTSTLLDPNICLDATNKRDKRSNSMHTTHIRINHLRVYDPPQTNNILLFLPTKISYLYYFLCLSLKIWVDCLVLCIEISHVNNQIFYNKHVSQRCNVCWLS